ncbi:hypothetical protein Tco_1205379, partial [Tanacetum coccineum]
EQKVEIDSVWAIGWSLHELACFELSFKENVVQKWDTSDGMKIVEPKKVPV